jgi:hypothetical protein
VLAFAGWIMPMSGVALWPTVVVHAALTIWCTACLRASAAKA